MLGGGRIHVKNFLVNFREWRNTYLGLVGDIENLADSSKLKEAHKMCEKIKEKILPNRSVHCVISLVDDVVLSLIEKNCEIFKTNIYFGLNPLKSSF